MGWPSAQEYNESIRNPDTCFQDLDLVGGKVDSNIDGLPQPKTGSFASVYRVTKKGTSWAVKLFHRQIDDHHVRYGEVEKALARVALPNFVKFEYLRQGIKVDGAWFPALKMQWSDGETLDNHIFNNVDLKPRLSFLTKEFKNLCFQLERASLAHGDLQHGNIVIETNKMRLVDYDNFFVPTLKGRQSLELGHPNYQHPKRVTSHFGPYLDNFAAWVIFTSLHCLTIDHQLWQRLAGGDECLLFRSSDFGDPCASYAFSVLEAHPSEEIRRSAKLLRSFCEMAPDKIPSINAALTQPVELNPLRAVSTVPAWIKNSETAQSTLRSQTHQLYSSFRAFNDAVRFPVLNFADAELRQGFCVLEDTVVGRNGRVYHFVCEDRDVAVKCFAFHVESRERHYEEIRKALQGSVRPYVAQVQYLQKGIHVGSEWFPILKMDWIPGPTIKRLSTQFMNDATASYLADRFAEMMKCFHSAGIAHGDLEFNNIIYTDNDLKVVDYDAMFVPSLAGRRSPETGHPAFQHPGRDILEFGPHIDNFSAWLMYYLLGYINVRPLITELVEICLRDEHQTTVHRTALRALETERDAETRQIGRLLSLLLTRPCSQTPFLNVDLGFEKALGAESKPGREAGPGNPFIGRRPR